MTVLLVPVIVVVVVLAVAAVGVKRWSAARERLADELRTDAVPSLDYRVPVGQDPAVVLAALRGSGLDATVDPAVPDLVRVACPAGADRERARVRVVIEDAGQPSIEEDPEPTASTVRFEDERQPPR